MKLAFYFFGIMLLLQELRKMSAPDVGSWISLVKLKCRPPTWGLGLVWFVEINSTPLDSGELNRELGCPKGCAPAPGFNPPPNSGCPPGCAVKIILHK
ncbi:hypothetical protein QE152_g930 [Popillia japonica]|uniref:Uncharacterized protein n=1 Tax=Popillia japonica TaxID=7064 RepID=A0AAW1N4F0_POPJA